MTPADRSASDGPHQEPHFGDFTSSPPPVERGYVSPPPTERGSNVPPPPVERVPLDVDPDQEAPFAAMPEFSERELQADTLAFEPVRRRPAANWSWVKWAMVLIILAGGAIAGWKYWGRDWWAMRNSGDEVPLVHAVDGPFKIRPEQPGGADFANRDKLVYQELEKGGAALPKTESLLPQPEKPLPPPAPRNPQPQMSQQQAAADPMSQEGALPSITGGEGQGDETEDDGPTVVATPPVVPPTTVAPGARTASPPPAPPASVATTSSLRPSPSEVRAAQPPAPPPAPPAVKTESDAAVATATPQVSANPRGYRIQISAVRSEADARSEWLRLRKQYDAVLGKLTLFVERADLGSKGIFYRIQAGAFNDKPAAEAACQQLVKQKVGCLVVRPEG